MTKWWSQYILHWCFKALSHIHTFLTYFNLIVPLGGGSLPRILQQVNVPIQTNSDCRRSLGTTITPGMICAGRIPEYEHDSCQVGNQLHQESHDDLVWKTHFFFTFLSISGWFRWSPGGSELRKSLWNCWSRIMGLWLCKWLPRSICQSISLHELD